jgi:phage gp16-like protein
VDPAVQDYSLADMRRAQFIAMMRSFHVSAEHRRQETDSANPSAKANVAGEQGDFKDKFDRRLLASDLRLTFLLSLRTEHL